MTVVLHGIDQVLAAVGRHFGYSDWSAVDEARTDLFAEATGDQRRDAGSVQDNLTLSLSNLLLPEVVTVIDVSAGINYGADRVRFSAPVSIGARLRAGVELVAAEPIPGGVQTTMRITMEVEHGNEPVCVVDSLSRFLA